MNYKSKWTKIKEWEHWPAYMFYAPLLPYALYECIKARNLCFFYSANPGIYHSGSGIESKHETLQIVPEKFRPRALLVPQHTSLKTVVQYLKERQLSFPLIAKPDIGFRGYLVKKLNSEADLKTYLNNFSEVTFILQEYIVRKRECGIFYSRLPGSSKGHISSITVKKFLKVYGNGISTLEALILNDKRAFLYYEILKRLHEDIFEQVLEKGLEFQLTVIGNHSKGTQFMNGNHLISEELVIAFDQFCSQMPGFYYGRLDIKYDELEDLIGLNNFKVLEVNGIIAEPGHMYDATVSGTSYFKAVRTQKQHWNILAQIARANHRINGIKYHAFSAFLKDIIWLRSYTQKIKRLNKIL